MRTRRGDVCGSENEVFGIFKKRIFKCDTLEAWGVDEVKSARVSVKVLSKPGLPGVI